MAQAVVARVIDRDRIPLFAPADNFSSCTMGVEMEMKVTTKKSAGFYIRAANNFLKGVEAREATDDKEAVEAKEPVDVLKISGLGEAINTAVAAATRAVAEGVGEITEIQTQYPEVTNSRGCAQITIVVKRK